MTRIAIIGAGLTGLTLGCLLGDRADVVLFDKSRGVGGRMATRRMGRHQFDHGAQYFTCKTRAFAAFLEPLARCGVVAPWTGEFVELDRARVTSRQTWGENPAHFVAVPGMNAMAKHLAASLDVRRETTVTRLERRGPRWQLRGGRKGDLGEFDWVVSTLPAAQAVDLMPSQFAAGKHLRSATMSGCYALMLGFDAPPTMDWHAARILNADISWVSIDNSKPGRPDAVSLVAHSTNAYADANLDADPERVRAHLMGELGEILDIDPTDNAACGLHRWRYANADRRDGQPALIDGDSGLVTCGDWCIRGRVEAAFSSAAAAAAGLAAFV